MERILVGVGPQTQKLWAAVHAVGLARRMQARVSFLLVLEPGPGGKGEISPPQRRELESLIDQVRSEGLPVEYYISQGSFEEELVRFTKEHRVTMLVIDQPTARGGAGHESTTLLEKIRHRVDCRIEVVQETARGLATLT